MARKRTGGATWKNGQFQIRVGVGLDRTWRPLQADLPPEERFREDQKPEADAYALRFRAMLEKKGPGCFVPKARVATLNEMFSKVWNPVRRKEGGARLAGEDEAAWRIHLSPMVIDDEGRSLGEMPPEAVTKTHAKRVSKTLAEMAKDPALKFGEARSRNVMGVVCKFFQDMAGSYDPNVSILDVDPFKDVRWPPKSKRRAIKQQLLPHEFLALISCPDTPLVDARSYAMALYTETRGGEVRTMMKADADVALRLFNVLRAYDAKASKEASQAASLKARRDVVRVVAKETKSGKSRSTEIEPNLLPLLLAMKAEPGDYFFPPPPDDAPVGNRWHPRPRNWLPPPDGETGLCETLRKNLRRALEWAGIEERPSLFDETDLAASLPIRFHDLRATGITWRHKRGDNPADIREQCGHEDEATNRLYTRKLSGLPLDALFPPLPLRLLGPGGSKFIGPAMVPGPMKSSRKSRDLVGAEGLEPPTSTV